MAPILVFNYMCACECFHVHVFAHASVHKLVCLCTWRPEVSLQYYFAGAVYNLFFLG